MSRSFAPTWLSPVSVCISCWKQYKVKCLDGLEDSAPVTWPVTMYSSEKLGSNPPNSGQFFFIINYGFVFFVGARFFSYHSCVLILFIYLCAWTLIFLIISIALSQNVFVKQKVSFRHKRCGKSKFQIFYNMINIPVYLSLKKKTYQACLHRCSLKDTTTTLVSKCP